MAWRGGVVRASVVSTDTHNWIGASSPGFIDSPFDMPRILVFDRDDKTDVARRSGTRSYHVAGRDHHRTFRETYGDERAASATVPHHSTCSISGIVTLVIGFSGSKCVRITNNVP
jgi:hypothetical protein